MQSTVCYLLAPTDRVITAICYRSASIRLVQSLPLIALTDSKALWTKRLYSTYLPLFTCEIGSMIEKWITPYQPTDRTGTVDGAANLPNLVIVHVHDVHVPVRLLDTERKQ